jgi:hypothetical protein
MKSSEFIEIEKEKSMDQIKLKIKLMTTLLL